MDKVWAKIDGLLDVIKQKLSIENYEKFNSKLEKPATLGVPVAIAVILVAGAVLAGKAHDGQFDVFMQSVKSAIVVLGLGYLSYRFSDGCRDAGKDARSRLSLGVYLDLLLVLGLAATVYNLYLAIDQLSNSSTAGVRELLVMAFAGLMFTWTVANPSRLGVYVDTSAGAANDAISLASMLVRVFIRIILPLSTLAIVISTVFTILALGDIIVSDNSGPYRVYAGIAGITSAVAMPVAMYLAYVVASFVIGLLENLWSLKAIERNTAGEVAEAPAAAVPPTFEPEPAVESSDE
jgi:hypothetical protein